MTELSEEGIGPLEKGQLRYRKQDYTGALEAFTEAVKVCTGHLLMNALDSRAATYEKLGKLQLALRDAKQMIDTEPRLSKGYLRCGKVLQLKGEPAIALKIYERGLNKVNIGEDSNRVNLQAMYTKLKNAQGSGVSRDPLQYLPLEIIEMIIEYLTMRDRVVCLAVLSSWKRILESSCKLWTTLDTTNVKKPISLKSLKIHLKRSDWALDRAIIKEGIGIGAERLELLTKNCRKLKEIQFIGISNGPIGNSLTRALPYAKNLETLAVGRELEIKLSSVHAILSNCKKHLVNATFLFVRSNHWQTVPDKWARMDLLKTIHLQSDVTSNFDIQGLCTATPNAVSVIINDWQIRPQFVDLSEWRNLKHLDISNTGITRWPSFPKSLTHLIASHNPRLTFKEDKFLPESLPLLETFASHATFISGKFLKLITQKSIEAGRLTRLAVGGRECSFDDSPVEDDYPASTSVQELSLASMAIGDDRMVRIVALYPNLKKLDASATKITGVAVREFVNGGITSLRLSECVDVSTDAVEWARGKGVEVEYLFPSRSVQSRVQRFGDSFFARGF